MRKISSEAVIYDLDPSLLEGGIALDRFREGSDIIREGVMREIGPADSMSEEHRLILSASSFAVHHALRNFSRPQHDYQLQDVFQNALLYVVRAAPLYDPSKGTFVSMLKRYIDENILKSSQGLSPTINDSSMIRIPLQKRSFAGDYGTVKNFKDGLRLKTKVQIEAEDLLQFGITHDAIDTFNQFNYVHGSPDEASEIIDYDPRVNPEDYILGSTEHDGIAKALQVLSPVECQIVIARLDTTESGRPRSYTDIGTELGYTHANISKIARGAYKKLASISNIVEVIQGLTSTLEAPYEVDRQIYIQDIAIAPKRQKSESKKVIQKEMIPPSDKPELVQYDIPFRPSGSSINTITGLLQGSPERPGLLIDLDELGLSITHISKVLKISRDNFIYKIQGDSLSDKEVKALLATIDKHLMKFHLRLEEVVRHNEVEIVTKWRDQVASESRS